MPFQLASSLPSDSASASRTNSSEVNNPTGTTSTAVVSVLHYNVSPTLNSVNEVYPHVDNNTRLLTIDQINEQFPVMMYKVWRTTRERDGLFIESGTATRSMNPSSDTTLRKAAHEQGNATIALKCYQKPDTAGDASRSSTDNAQAANTMASSILPITSDYDTKADDLPLSRSARAAEATCAICLEVPADHDVVRTLKCGHCYHQACIDPWLTSRSGACPLCKRDYYLPPEPESAAERESTLPWTANEHRSLHETWEPNSRVENTHRNDLAPPSPALTHASRVPRMSDSWGRTNSLSLLLYAFRRERNPGNTEDGSSRLERGEV